MTSPRTLNEIFFGAIDRYPAASVAMRAKIAGTWTDFDYRFVLDQVQCSPPACASWASNPAIALRCCRRIGPSGPGPITPASRARCADVPIYPTLPPQHIGYILRDSGAAAIIVSSRAQLEKVLAIRYPDVTSCAEARHRHRPGCDRAGRPLLQRCDRQGTGGTGEVSPLARRGAARWIPTISPP